MVIKHTYSIQRAFPHHGPNDWPLWVVGLEEEALLWPGLCSCPIFPSCRFQEGHVGARVVGVLEPQCLPQHQDQPPCILSMLLGKGNTHGLLLLWTLSTHIVLGVGGVVSLLSVIKQSVPIISKESSKGKGKNKFPPLLFCNTKSGQLKRLPNPSEEFDPID